MIYAKTDAVFVSGCKTIVKKMPKAMERASLDAMKKGRTAFRKKDGGAPGVYNIKAKELKGTTDVRKEKNEVSLVIKSRRFTIGTSTHFSISPKAYRSQKGIPVDRRPRMYATIIRGQRHAFPHAFIANPGAIHGGNTMLWGRKKGGRSVTTIKSLSAAQMAENKKVYGNIRKAIDETFKSRMKHYYEVEVNKLASRKR